MSAMLSIFGKAFSAFFIKLLISLATERFIKWFFFYVGEQIVKSTKTDQDDIFMQKIKEAYEQDDSGSISTK